MSLILEPNIYKLMAKNCNLRKYSTDPCTVGMLQCPFSGTMCTNIHAIHWKKFYEQKPIEVKERTDDEE